MAKKYSFAVENVEMFEENPESNFAVLSLDFFSSGKNLHDLFVSEDTLLRTANSIKKCPLVWKYDEVLDDIYTHDDEEVPCGFIPETASIEAKPLPDGRTMLSTKAYVWKRYTGPLLDIFKRDGGIKPVSVEMSVYKIEPMQDGLYELLDYRFEGVTILGSYVRPAIPNASATVLSFSEMKKEYEKALEDEVSSQDIHLAKSFKEQINRLKEDPIVITFPYKSKSEMNPALKGISPPISVAQANEIARQADAIGTDGEKNGWAIAISNFKKTHKVENGKWVKKKEEAAMSEENMSENVQDENLEKEKNMPKDILEKNSIEEQKIVSKEEFSESESKEEEEKMAEEEKPEEEKEKEKEEEKEFQYPENFNMEEMAALFAEDEEDEDIKMAKEEISKGKFASPQVLMSGMFAQMRKMAKRIQDMSEKNKMYMEENEQLKKFKEEVEGRQKKFEVEATLQELESRVVVPEEDKEEMIASAENYSLENIEAWKNLCKAKSFDYAIREQKEEDEDNIEKVGLPYDSSSMWPKKEKSESLWE